MAEIVPFRAILYNPEKVPNIADVVSPPYDVISKKEQEGYYARHPQNVIRLDKNKPSDGDTDIDNPFTRAAGNFINWQENKILIRDPEPAFYLTSVEFEMEGNPVIRYGLITRVRIEPFSKGIILPHEKTFSKVKSERFELIKRCHANFSPVFSIFSDKSDIFDTLIRAVDGMEPVFDFVDDAGHRHRLWRITDPKIQKKVIEGVRERRFFIADGHHRYETTLNYREWIHQQHSDLPDEHPSNFIMMYLCAIQDPGLIILPAHRLLSDVPESVRNEFYQISAPYFDIEMFPVVPENQNQMLDTLRGRMAADTGQHKIGVFIKGKNQFSVLTLKPGIMAQYFENTIEAPLRELDVTVLTRLIFFNILGFDETMLDNEKVINFTSKEKEAVSSIMNGDYDMAFILNSTTNEQVRKIAEKGLTMPRKSTYYYPKAITGMVMNTLID